MDFLTHDSHKSESGISVTSPPTPVHVESFYQLLASLLFQDAEETQKKETTTT